MKINILLPYKEKFDENKASSVSITVSNNMRHSKFLDDIRVFGQLTENPMFQKNFVGIKYSLLSFKSKNNYLADHLSKKLLEENNTNQVVEIHNRPHLVKRIKKKVNFTHKTTTSVRCILRKHKFELNPTLFIEITLGKLGPDLSRHY